MQHAFPSKNPRFVSERDIRYLHMFLRIKCVVTRLRSLFVFMAHTNRTQCIQSQAFGCISQVLRESQPVKHAESRSTPCPRLRSAMRRNVASKSPQNSPRNA